MSTAENQEAAAETKNAEAGASLNGQEVILVIPAAESGCQGLRRPSPGITTRSLCILKETRLGKEKKKLRKSLRSILNRLSRFLLICLRDLKDLSLSLKPAPSWSSTAVLIKKGRPLSARRKKTQRKKCPQALSNNESIQGFLRFERQS